MSSVEKIVDVKEKLLPVRMNALWFTYVALFLFALLPNFGPELDFLQIFSASTVFVLLVNLWSLYTERPVIDERKQEVMTEAMAWAFVVVSLLLIPAGTTGVELNSDLIRDTAEMGLWTWVIVFSVKNLWQEYGGGEK